MSHIILNNDRNPAAEQAYEIAWDFLARAGLLGEEFDACVFLAQRIAEMVDQGQTNRIRMANRAISQYQAHIAERDRLLLGGGRRAGVR